MVLNKSNHASLPSLLNSETPEIKVVSVAIEFTRIGEIGLKTSIWHFYFEILISILLKTQ